jgi:small subunit ribosomal protein S2
MVRAGRTAERVLGLPFAHFLENRQAFLESIAQRCRLEKGASASDAEGVDGEAVSTYGSLSGPGGNVTVERLLQSSVHLGHDAARWCPRMKPFILGERHGIHILNLDRTLVHLRLACAVVREISRRNGKVLFVGTRNAAIQRLVYECALKCQGFYVNQRWIGGTLSNAAQVLGKGLAYAGTWSDDPAALRPDLLVVLDYPRQANCLREAERALVPTVAICDSDCDPTKVTYPIAGNDDAYSSVELIARLLALSAHKGRLLAVEQQDGKKPAGPFQEALQSAGDFVERAKQRRHDISYV